MIFSKFQVQFWIRIHNLELRIRILTDSDPDPQHWWSVMRNCEISAWMQIWILWFFPKSKNPDPTFINQGLDSDLACEQTYLSGESGSRTLVIMILWYN
jgi:hypothetical protein